MNLFLSPAEIAKVLPKGKTRSRFYGEADEEQGPLAAYTPSLVRRGFSSLGFAYAPRSLAFINLKGGVGKTTSSLAIASRAAQYGFRVALLDLDSQASATLALGARVEPDTAIFLDIWSKPEEMTLPSLHRVAEHLYLLPSSLENGLLESSLANPAAQKKAVSRVVGLLKQEGFDLVVVDCPPSLGTAVISTVCAVDQIVIPISCDDFSYRGMELTLGEVESICDTFGLEKPDISILPTGVDRRIKLWDGLKKRLHDEHPERALSLYIRTSSEFAKALAAGKGIFEGRAKSNGREDYDRFARLLLGIDSFTAGLKAPPKRP